MDKIIGLGNALIDVLATLKDDTLLDELELPKGSMPTGFYPASGLRSQTR